MKKIVFILALLLLQAGCAAFQRDVEITDEVLQDEERIVDDFKTKK